eukprot:scaffold10222_cov135-Isochrysis_galbana.AAC.4
MAPELPRAVCLACGCTGQSVLLSAGGKKPFSAALLPRCGCIFRLHKARRLPAISALLASTTLPAEPAGCCTVTVLAEGAPGPDQTPAMLLATRQPATGVNEEEHAASKSGAGHAQRPVMSAHQLQESLAGGSREIMVYGTAVCEEVRSPPCCPPVHLPLLGFSETPSGATPTQQRCPTHRRCLVHWNSRAR